MNNQLNTKLLSVLIAEKQIQKQVLAHKMRVTSQTVSNLIRENARVIELSSGEYQLIKMGRVFKID